MRRGNEQVPELEKLTRAFISLLRKISEFSVKRFIFLAVSGILQKDLMFLTRVNCNFAGLNDRINI